MTSPTGRRTSAPNLQQIPLNTPEAKRIKAAFMRTPTAAAFDRWRSIVDRILMDNGHSPTDSDEVDAMKKLFDEGVPPSEAAEDLLRDY